MINGYRKYSFSAISIKKEVASRFRKFSKQISKSNTEALEAMLNFFDWNDISPNDDLGVKNERTNKRINAVIAILKNIEKHQTKPTAVMLQTLFKEVSNNEIKEEIYNFETPNLISENEELTYYRNAYHKNQESYNVLKSEVEKIIKKSRYIKSNFGTGYYRLEVTKDEFQQFKQTLDNVYNDNSSENGR